MNLSPELTRLVEEQRQHQANYRELCAAIGKLERADLDMSERATSMSYRIRILDRVIVRLLSKELGIQIGVLQ